LAERDSWLSQDEHLVGGLRLILQDHSTERIDGIIAIIMAIGRAICPWLA
jgi:hypothetical protein